MCTVTFIPTSKGIYLTSNRDEHKSVVFKSTHQNQAMLLPPDLNELIAINHPVRVVSEVLEIP